MFTDDYGGIKHGQMNICFFLKIYFFFEKYKPTDKKNRK